MKVATWVALSMSVAAWLVSYVPGHRRLEQPLEQPQDVDVEAERPNEASVEEAQGHSCSRQGFRGSCCSVQAQAWAS